MPELTPDTFVRVRWGRTGSQVAYVVTVNAGTGRVQVRKRRANSRTWTGPLWINVGEVLGDLAARPGEIPQYEYELSQRRPTRGAR